MKNDENEITNTEKVSEKRTDNIWNRILWNGLGESFIRITY